MFTNVTTIEITHSYTEQGIDCGIVDARENLDSGSQSHAYDIDDSEDI